MNNRTQGIFTGKIYHVYNRSIDKRRIFDDTDNSSRFLDLMRYYQTSQDLIRYSRYLDLEKSFRSEVDQIIKVRKYFKIEILTFCLMPTHFHFLIKQKIDKGISKFISDVTNAFTRYYNIKTKRTGPIFNTGYKSKIIHNRNELLHVSRYIHLNPFSSGLITNKAEILRYPKSSLNQIISSNANSDLINSKTILQNFGQTAKAYEHFVLENADYQKKLELIKYS